MCNPFPCSLISEAAIVACNIVLNSCSYQYASARTSAAIVCLLRAYPRIFCSVCKALPSSPLCCWRANRPPSASWHPCSSRSQALTIPVAASENESCDACDAKRWRVQGEQGETDTFLGHCRPRAPTRAFAFRCHHRHGRSLESDQGISLGDELSSIFRSDRLRVSSIWISVAVVVFLTVLQTRTGSWSRFASLVFPFAPPLYSSPKRRPWL